MSSEGLSLFMDKARSSQIMTNNIDMTILMEYVQLATNQNINQAEDDRLEELRVIMVPPEVKPREEIQYTFSTGRYIREDGPAPSGLCPGRDLRGPLLGTT